MGLTKALLLEHGERSLTVMFRLPSDVKNCEDVFWVLCELQTTILLPLSPYWELYKHNQTHKHQRAAAASHWWRAPRRKHLSPRELNTAISVEARDRKWSITGGIWMETVLKMTRTFHNPTRLQRPWRHRHRWRKTLSLLGGSVGIWGRGTPDTTVVVVINLRAVGACNMWAVGGAGLTLDSPKSQL